MSFSVSFVDPYVALWILISEQEDLAKYLKGIQEKKDKAEQEEYQKNLKRILGSLRGKLSSFNIDITKAQQLYHVAKANLNQLVIEYKGNQVLIDDLDKEETEILGIKERQVGKINQKITEAKAALKLAKEKQAKCLQDLKELAPLDIRKRELIQAKAEVEARIKDLKIKRQDNNVKFAALQARKDDLVGRAIPVEQSLEAEIVDAQAEDTRLAREETVSTEQLETTEVKLAEIQPALQQAWDKVVAAGAEVEEKSDVVQRLEEKLEKFLEHCAELHQANRTERDELVAKNDVLSPQIQAAQAAVQQSEVDIRRQQEDEGRLLAETERLEAGLPVEERMVPQLTEDIRVRELNERKMRLANIQKERQALMQRKEVLEHRKKRRGTHLAALEAEGEAEKNTSQKVETRATDVALSPLDQELAALDEEERNVNAKIHELEASSNVGNNLSRDLLALRGQLTPAPHIEPRAEILPQMANHTAQPAMGGEPHIPDEANGRRNDDEPPPYSTLPRRT